MRFTIGPDGYDPKHYEDMAEFAALADGMPTEVAPSVFYYFLELMPPREWQRADGVERFIVCEPYCDNRRGTVYLQLAKKDGRCYAKYVTKGHYDTYMRSDNLDPAWEIEPRLAEVYCHG